MPRSLPGTETLRRPRPNTTSMVLPSVVNNKATFNITINYHAQISPGRGTSHDISTYEVLTLTAEMGLIVPYIVPHSYRECPDDDVLERSTSRLNAWFSISVHPAYTISAKNNDQGQTPDTTYCYTYSLVLLTFSTNTRHASLHIRARARQLHEINMRPANNRLFLIRSCLEHRQFRQPVTRVR